jgi:hypothetical protein
MRYVPLVSVAITVTNERSAQFRTKSKNSTHIDLALPQHFVLSEGLVVIYPNEKLWRHWSSREGERFIPGNVQTVSGI